MEMSLEPKPVCPEIRSKGEYTPSSTKIKLYSVFFLQKNIDYMYKTRQQSAFTTMLWRISRPGLRGIIMRRITG